jgi:hypothetical protein
MPYSEPASISALGRLSCFIKGWINSFPCRAGTDKAMVVAVE